ncbi:hypothetical protein O181_012686 [Austropuccinia psidii MF-1]|uniref:NmrA-like domain-containing protein n=1 Tax=Austropuccinia psidii MF-1 TaxID=1389203 RepID=A0A9Q3BYA4_9BASI|nr:hypothetical protein [Austropuccinia psidii MF-1]
MAVAIAGGTGNLGRYISGSLLVEPFNKNFSQIKILTRNPSSDLAKQFSAAGASVIKVEGPSDWENALKDVVLLIDALGYGPGTSQVKNELLESALKAPNLKYYIPADFGLDQRQCKVKHPLFLDKMEREERAKASGKLKVVSIHPGLFLEMGFLTVSYSPEGGKYEVAGDGNTPMSLTAIADVGLSAASIASHLIQGKGDQIPEHIRIGGISTTPLAAVEFFNRVAPDQNSLIKIEKHPLAEFKAQYIKEKDTGFKGFLDLLLILGAEGAFDHSKINDNTLVNPNLWRFTTFEEYAHDVNGRPASDIEPKNLESILYHIKAKLAK